MKIRWTNRYSGEQGYVLEVKSDHFVNTYSREESACFKTRRDAEKAVALLCGVGEGVNNDFEIVTNKE